MEDDSRDCSASEVTEHRETIAPIDRQGTLCRGNVGIFGRVLQHRPEAELEQTTGRRASEIGRSSGARDWRLVRH